MTRHDVISLVYANDEVRIMILLFQYLSKAHTKNIRKYISKLLHFIHANDPDKLNCELNEK